MYRYFKVAKQSISIMIAICLLITGNLFIIFRSDIIAKAIDGEDITLNSENSNDNSYEKYLDTYKTALRPMDKINLDNKMIKEKSATGIDILPNYNEKENLLKLSGSDNYVVYEFEVLSEGLYNIEMEYIPFSGQKHSQISLNMEIDGKVPHSQLTGMVFCRPWEEMGYFKQDSRGNDLQKSQNEKFYWMSSFFFDSEGKYNDPLLFYFSKEKHTIKIIGAQTDFIISNLQISNEMPAPKYSQLSKEYSEKGFTEHLLYHAS